MEGRKRDWNRCRMENQTRAEKRVVARPSGIAWESEVKKQRVRRETSVRRMLFGVSLELRSEREG
jgi:hypothetical protein